MIHYVIAAHFGPRPNSTKAYREDPTAYLVEHFASLAQLKHSINQVTVVSSWPGRDPLFRLWLPSTIGTAVVRKMHRKYDGGSWGAILDALSLWQGRFTHTIFIEDDTIFTQDHFDSYLVEGLHEDTGWIRMGSAGIVEQEATHIALKKATDQASFAAEMRLHHFVVQDGLERYANAVLGGNGVVQWGGDHHTTAFTVPIPALDKLVLVDFGGPTEKKTIERDGRFA